MTEIEKNEIIEKILDELKSKKLMNPKSSYKSTEKILYSFKVLPQAIKLIEKEILKLEEENKTILKAPTKSNKLVLNESDSTYIYGDEILETRISELKQIVIKTNSQIRLVKQALNHFKEDEYYDIIPKYYFEEKTIGDVAEEMGYAIGTISKHKTRLINELKVYIFPDTFMNELK